MDRVVHNVKICIGKVNQQKNFLFFCIPLQKIYKSLHGSGWWWEDNEKFWIHYKVCDWLSLVCGMTRNLMNLIRNLNDRLSFILYLVQCRWLNLLCRETRLEHSWRHSAGIFLTMYIVERILEENFFFQVLL